MDEIKKSINAILYDRFVSPLSGSFILSWCVINWRIIYATLFISSSELGKNKVDFVSGELSIDTSVFWPLASTILLITIYPRVSEYAYQISLYYKGRKRKLKNKYEESQLLSLEQSIEIRLQLKSQLERFDKISSDKDQLISELKVQNEGLVNRLTVIEKRLKESQRSKDRINPKTKIEENDDYMRFLANKENQRVLQELYHQQPVWSDGEFARLNLKIIKDLELLDLVIGHAEVIGGYKYSITEKGKSYLKKYGA